MENDIYRQFIFYRTYSRWNDTLKRRETWEETVDRYMSYMKGKLGSKLKEKEYAELRTAIIRQDVMPSMRLLWAAGNAVDRTNTTAYNCSFIAPTKPQDFGEILYLLTCGCGVGFSVERKFVDEFPEVEKQTGEVKNTIVVKDDKEGWADALVAGMKAWFAGKDITFDYSKIRPSGARLKTMGGRASGPEPLKGLLNFTRDKMLSRQGRKLRPIDVHDIVCKIGDVVVSGGVRRSSEISLSDLNEDDMRDAKKGSFYMIEPQRSMANNSAVFNEKPSQTEFMREWLSLMESGTGERGIFNRGGLETQMPPRRYAITNGHMGSMGVNPCVPFETKILTDVGQLPIGETIGKEINVWNGKEFSPVVPFSAGQSETLKVKFDNGVELECTPYHTFVLADDSRVEAKDLTPGDALQKYTMPVIEAGTERDPATDAYSQGFYAGDGNRGYTFSFVYNEKEQCIPRLVGSVSSLATYGRRTWKHGPMIDKSFVPVNASKKYALNWLAGLFDSDGTVNRNPNSSSVVVSSIDKDFLLNVRLLLTRLGVQAKVVKECDGRDRLLPDGRGGEKEYHCAPSWRLIINAVETSLLLGLGLKTNRLQFLAVDPNRNAARFIRVVSVEETGDTKEVYCFTEPKNHTGTFNGLVTGQCGEINLRSKQFCNLSEVVAREDDDVSSLMEKIRLATILGTYQSSLTEFEYLSKEWKKNCDEEALLGVSITGQYDCPTVRKPLVLRKLREHAIKVNREYATRLGISRSTAITCVKPSGTVSQLVDSSSGLHPRFARYYIRRVRISTTDPLFKMLRDQGMPSVPEVGQDNMTATTFVHEFPIKAPDGAITADKLNALEQLEYWKMVKTNYTEHNPSATIYIEEDEWLSVANWVWNNWDIVGGLSFLPKTNHVYLLAPYEKINRETYEALVKKMPKIDFTQLTRYELEDETTGSKELACTGNVCEIV